MNVPSPGSTVLDVIERPLRVMVGVLNDEACREALDATATVRGEMASLTAAVERLTEERDEWERKAPVWTAQAVEPWQQRAKSAEAEVARLSSLLETTREGLRGLEPYAERAEMRWMSVEDATIEVPARAVAEAVRSLAASPGSGDPADGGGAK